MNPNEPKSLTLSTLDGNTLMAQEFEPLRFSVEKILPHGLFILAGSPKIGKSWLSLDLCRAVATGGKLWEYETRRGDVLYLALEDTLHRLQNRLRQMDAEKLDISRLHMATASFGLQDGLLEQIHNFVAANPDTNLIVIVHLDHHERSHLVRQYGGGRRGSDTRHQLSRTGRRYRLRGARLFRVVAHVSNKI